MADPKNPPSFHEAIANASQSIAGSIGAPDYDPQFAGMIMDVFHKFITQPKGGTQKPGPGGAGGPAGGPPPPGGPPPTDAGPDSAPGVSAPAGSAGGSPVNSAMMSNQTPGAPTPGGMTQGLTPSPDELRRVLSDVAGK